jgi:flagellar biosynthesis protein FlhA
MSDAASNQPAPGGEGGFKINSLFRSDLGLALVVIGILLTLIMPMPSWLLDLMLAASITLSVLILMTSLFIEKPLELSTFPTILLISTMMRLALNLASTRLILSDGHEGTDAAGKVIEAFGGFLMGDQVVIGVIIFSILIIVNFIVITKGSGRIAEVAARFTLDAMPGKQMAIDADLSAGMIDEASARARRTELEDESTFFGSMDGAAKFVRGDAVAGILITFINIVGGIIIGTVNQDMAFADAADRYTRLTVGDGLVTQIPALIVSTAAGLMVTKAGVRGATDKALVKQLGGYPKAIGISSALLFALSLLPGLPFFPFATLGSLLAYMAYSLTQKNKEEVTQLLVEKQHQLQIEEQKPVEETISQTLAIDQIRLELGYALLPLINDDSGYRLTDQIKALRRQLAADMGFVMPSVRILDNMQLPTNSYAIRVKESEVGRGDVRPGMLLVMDPRGEPVGLSGEDTVEPAFGLPAKWVDNSLKEEASFRGYTVVDAATVVTTHITEIIKDNMPELLSYAETQKLLDDLPSENQKLIGDLIPNQITTSGIQRVLQNLLGEQISIRDLPTILEGISEATGYSQNIVTISEHVRGRLSRQISAANTNDAGYIPLLTLSPEWEQSFAESLIGQGDDKQLAMPPSKLQEFIGAVRMTFEQQAQAGEMPILLTSPGVRPFVRSIIERVRPSTVIMSQNEIHPKAQIRTLGQI